MMFECKGPACFFHCLEYLKLWDAGNRVVISDRLADHNLAWIKNKRIAVIDEVIVTGTSLYKLVEQLKKAGALSVKIYALFVNKAWFVEDFFESHIIEQSFIRLAPSEAQSLGSSIVEAMHSIPRPYSIDYPMSGWNVLSWHAIQNIFIDTEWETNDIPTAVNLSPSTSLSFFRTTPAPSLSKNINSALGFDVYENSLLKIRMYGRWEQPSEGQSRYHFRIVPYVVLGELRESELNRCFSLLIKTLPDQMKVTITNSCNNGIAKLRLFQYVMASRLARAWCIHISQRGLQATFVHDSREMSLVFPKEIHEITTILGCCDSSTQPHKIIFESSAQPTHQISDSDEHKAQRPITDADIYSRLIGLFSRLYREKEIPLRENAKKLGRKIFSSASHRTMLNRLDDGITFKNLLSHVVALGVSDTRFAVSSFIDIAVDQGLIVPITVTRLNKQSGERHYFRAYRHGEETYIVERDLALFRRMLLKVQQTIKKYSQKNDSAILPPTLAQGRIPNVVLEKILVLFVRHCIHTNTFNQVFTGASHLRNQIKLSIGRDLHGVRVAIGDHLPTETLPNAVFVNWLKSHSIISTNSSSGYHISDNDDIEIPDRQRQRIADRFGLTLGHAVTAIIQNEHNTRKDGQSNDSPADILNRSLIVLTTCENSASTLLAVGAELRRLSSELQQFPIFNDSAPHILLKRISSYQFTGHILTAANSAHMKIKAFLLREADTKAMELSLLLKKIDDSYALDWDEIWDSSRKHSGRDEEKIENHKLFECTSIVSELIFALYNFEILILSTNSEILSTKQKRRLIDCRKSLNKKVSEISALGKRLEKLNTEIHRSFGELYVKISNEEIRRANEISSQTNQEKSLSIFNRLNSAKVLAGQMYSWIDQAYANRGRLANLEYYEHLLCLKFSPPQGQAADITSEIISLLIRSSQNAGQGKSPREYSQSNRIADTGASYIFYTTHEDNNRADKNIYVYARGFNGARWLGHIAGRTFQVCNDIEAPQIVCALGLERSRRIVRNTETSQLLSNNPMREAVITLNSELKQKYSNLALLCDVDKDDVLRRGFIDELSGVMKSHAPQQISLERTLVAPLGGEFMLSIHKSNTHSISSNPKVGIVFIVNDEGATFIDVIKNMGIEAKRKISKQKSFLEFDMTLGGTKLSFIALQSGGQGNVDASLVLSELISISEKSPLTAIIVLGICCNFHKPSRLKDVIIPMHVLDTQLKVQKPNAVTPRNSGRDFRKDVRELISAFFVDCVRDNTIKSTLGTIDGSVRQGIMVSDNDLLRDGSANQYHRTQARDYNDGAVAYDMETAGVVRWLQQIEGVPPTFVVKGLSDQGNAHKKDDENRSIAARNATFVALELAKYVVDIKQAGYPSSTVTDASI